MALVLSLSLPFSLSLPLDQAPPPRLIGELVQLRTSTGTLHGIIDLPPRRGPWPVVILHAGSGPTDRDGNGPLVRTDNLKILGRTLAGGGVAVLRIDKRGVGASSKALAKEEDARLESYAADVSAWAANLREDPRFTKLGLIGHSEGALIGLIAARHAKPDSYVSICGPGRPLQEVLREQLKKNLPEDLYKASDTIIADLEAGRVVKDVSKGLASLFRPSVQPFLISAFKHDPAKLVAEFSGPVLVVAGSTDIQVSAADAKRLGGGNPKAKVVTIDGMNHVLKVVEGTHRVLQLPSYSDPTLPLHPKLVPELAAFLNESLGGK